MKLHYYRHPVAPNFGDELNAWLWPELIGDCLDDDTSSLFIGIGSVLAADLPAHKMKIVMGAGYGAYGPAPTLDKTWKVYFVRGPQTAEHLGLSPQFAITDSAILVRHVFKAAPPAKRYRVSYIPHWESIYSGHWQRACSMAGLHFIDPRLPVETVLEEILASEMIVAEAMHGAIVADALRVPWVPVLPVAFEHRFKWTDWTRSVGVPYRPRLIGPTSWVEIRKLTKNGRFYGALRDQGCSQIGSEHSWSAVKRSAKRFTKDSIAGSLLPIAAGSLWRLSRVEPSLSRDGTVESLTDRAFGQVQAFRRDFGADASVILARGA